MSNSVRTYHCARCGQEISEKGLLCRDCVYVLPLTERRAIWSKTWSSTK